MMMMMGVFLAVVCMIFFAYDNWNWQDYTVQRHEDGESQKVGRFLDYMRSLVWVLFFAYEIATNWRAKVQDEQLNKNSILVNRCIQNHCHPRTLDNKRNRVTDPYSRIILASSSALTNRSTTYSVSGSTKGRNSWQKWDQALHPQLRRRRIMTSRERPWWAPCYNQCNLWLWWEFSSRDVWSSSHQAMMIVTGKTVKDTRMVRLKLKFHRLRILSRAVIPLFFA